MNYKKFKVNNCDVYFVKTNKFKTITIDTLFINEYDTKDFTKQKLLSNFMVKTTNKYKDELKLKIKKLELFDLDYSTYNMYLNYHIKNHRLIFLNEKYTEKGMNKKSIDFYYDFIYNPNVENNEFEKQSFLLSKERLKQLYKRQKENPTILAEQEAFSLISDDLPIKYKVSGNEEDLENITQKELLDFYLNEIETSNVKVFVIGDINEEDLIDILSKKLKKCNKKEYNIGVYDLINKEKTTKKITDDIHNQSILINVYKILNITERERQIVLPVFNEILGGSNSKLFINVREKNSLAYYIFSSIYIFQSILIIESGISKDNYEKVNKIINEQLDEMKNGKISEEELNSVKQKIKANILEIEDSEAKILNNVEDEVIFGLKENKEFLTEIDSVTVDELSNLALKLNLDVEYLFKGVK